MPKVWQLQEAKNKFSEVVDEAQEHGPQIITRRGEEVAVVISYAEYSQLRRKKPQPLSEFFRQSPLYGVELDLSRDKDIIRSPIEFDL